MLMNYRRYLLAWMMAPALLLQGCGGAGSREVVTGNDVQVWITTGDQQQLLARKPGLAFIDTAMETVIAVDTTKRFQTIDGFGYTLTGGSADLMNEKLSETERQKLLRELFLTDDDGIGISYLRISVGASDLDDHVFSYCDLPPEQTYPELTRYTLEEDEENLIPVLKEILALNPDIKIMGSPWSAPVWMKSNGKAKGGSLLPRFYPSY